MFAWKTWSGQTRIHVSYRRILYLCSFYTGHVLQISTSKRVYDLRCRSRPDLLAWILALRRACGKQESHGIFEFGIF